MATKYSPSFASWNNVTGVTDAASSSMLDAAEVFNKGAATTTTIGNELEKMHEKALKKREEELKAIGERQKEQLRLSSMRSDGSIDAAKYTEGLNDLEQVFRSANQEPNYMNTDVKTLLGDTGITELYDAETARRNKHIAASGLNARTEADKKATDKYGAFNPEAYVTAINGYLTDLEKELGRSLSETEKAMFYNASTGSYGGSNAGSTSGTGTAGNQPGSMAKQIQQYNAIEFGRNLNVAQDASDKVSDFANKKENLIYFTKDKQGNYQNETLRKMLAPISAFDPNIDEQLNSLFVDYGLIDKKTDLTETQKNNEKQQRLVAFAKDLGQVFTANNIRNLAARMNIIDNEAIEKLITLRQDAETHQAGIKSTKYKEKLDTLKAAYGSMFGDTLDKTLNNESISSITDDADLTLYDEAAKSVASALTEVHGLEPADALLLAKSFIRQRINVVEGELTDEARTLLAAMKKNPFVEAFVNTTLKHFPDKKAEVESLAAKYKKGGGTTPTTQLSRTAEEEVKYIKNLKHLNVNGNSILISEDVNAALWYLDEALKSADKLSDPDEQRAVMVAAYENVSPLIFNMLVNVSPEIQNDRVLQDKLKESVDEIIHGHGLVWDASTKKEFLGELGDDFKSKVIRKELVKGYEKLSPEQRKLLDRLIGFRAGNYTLANMFRHVASWF